MTDFERHIQLSEIFIANNNNLHSYIELCRDAKSMMNFEKFKHLSNAVEKSRKHLEKFIEEQNAKNENIA